MIWLTGKNGQLGSQLEELLKEKGIEYFSTGHELNLCDEEKMMEFVEPLVKQKKQIDFIINCAGFTDVERAEKEVDLAFENNVLLTDSLVACAELFGSTLIHVSSDYVFDGTASTPITEDASTNPINSYGKSKELAETTVTQGLEKYYIIRTSWLYGKNGKNFVKTILSKLKEGQNLSVVDNQTGSPTNARELAELILQLTETKIPYGIYNFSCEGECSWFDFACEIQRLASENNLLENISSTITPCQEHKCLAKRPAYSVLDKSKIKKELGVNIPDWKDSLQDFFKKDLSI